MGSPSLVRPHRRLALPFVVVLYPLLWFVVRDARIVASARPDVAVVPRTLAFALAAVVVSYVVAVAVAATLDFERTRPSRWTRLLLVPSNEGLVIFGAISVAFGAYVVAGVAFAFPGWFETVATLVGIVLGWPLFVTYGGVIVVENALVTGSTALEFVAVAVGVALSAAWTLLLSGWFADLVNGGDSASVATR